MNKFLDIAYYEAKKAYNKNEVPIGAVIVKNNKIIAKAYNKKNIKNMATYHAEVLAINKACKKLKTWHLDDCELYVTMEPCLMCVGAIVQSRIKKIVYSCKNEKYGCIEFLKKDYIKTNNFNINIEQINDQKIVELLKLFFKNKRNN